MLLTRILGTSVLIALGALGLTACLRMADTPDPWPCATDADCEEGGACFRPTSDGRGECRTPGYCEYDVDCSGTTACIANACVPVQCTHDDQATCAPYVCNNRACRTSCSHSSDCDSQHACQAGECVPM